MSSAEEALQSRAGRYVRQPLGYRAFIPSSLPPVPPVVIDHEMQRLLTESALALGRLDGSIQTLPNPDLFVFMYIRKEAVLSSQIEGTQASINDLIRAEAGIFDPQTPKDVDEVVNYIAAMNHGLARLQDLPISIRLIREIHEKLMQGVRGYNLQPGELRVSQNWIGPAGSSLRDASFVPPPHHEAAQALGKLERFLHDEQPLPDLIKIGLAHAQFETIHPFLDGNGRVGRLLITFLLCSDKILQRPVLYLSYFLKKHRTEYYDRLQAIRDHGDWEGWLKFFLKGVVEVSGGATQTARNIVSLREEHRALIAREFGHNGAKAIHLLENLYQRPSLNVNDVKMLLKISYPNANALVEKFVSNGLLFEVTGQARNRRFLYSPYIALFSELE